ncbi:MAG: DUF5698 domain-containing protein [Deltaproteobacteria bacterium]|nr:DUF5698 domain-containing protein [Deltaproteobacteria bacterium]
MFNTETILLGLLVFTCRCVDVSCGTMRTIAVVNGRILASFLLGLVEVSVWLTVISFLLPTIQQAPLLGVFYALGYSSGNVLGVYLERLLPIGNLTLRIFLAEKDIPVIDKIRAANFRVTAFEGKGRDGRIILLFVFIKKKNLRKVLRMIKEQESNIFYTVDYGGETHNNILTTETNSFWRNWKKSK